MNQHCYIHRLHHLVGGCGAVLLPIAVGVMWVCGFPWGRFLVRFGVGAVILTWMGLLWLLGGVPLVTGLAACPWVLGVLHLQAGVLVDVSLRLWVGALVEPSAGGGGAQPGCPVSYVVWELSEVWGGCSFSSVVRSGGPLWKGQPLQGGSTFPPPQSFPLYLSPSSRSITPPHMQGLGVQVCH